jgi:AcrR family transcriptional regulator
LADLATSPISTKPGLRSRKKAKRRDEIITAARELFARQGIDATTMAEIAAASGISAPTVFNYFGSKDGILIEMISAGTAQAREVDRDLHWQPSSDLGALILTLFLRVSDRTLAIAGKRVWRYAEAAAIRRPETEFSRQYAEVTQALVAVVAEFFAGMELRMRSGAAGDPAYPSEYSNAWPSPNHSVSESTCNRMQCANCLTSGWNTASTRSAYARGNMAFTQRPACRSG